MDPTKPLPQTRFSPTFLHVSLLISIAAFALLWKLGTGSLAAWDEAIYAQVSKEIVRGGDWLTMHWGYRPWFEKPPLFLWITALFYEFFGVSEFWARVPSALSGIALIGLTYVLGKFAYNARVGLLAAIILLTCYHFLSFARFGTTDVMLTLLTFLAIYAYLRLTNRNQNWWYVVWVSCALALMVKGMGGAIAPGAILFGLMFERKLSAAIRSTQFWLGLLLAFVIIGPWHILMYAWYGRSFIDEYIGYHVIARSSRTLEGQPSSYLYYVGKLIDGFFPWCLVAPFAIVSNIRRSHKDRSSSRVLLLLCALVFVLYTLIPTRRPWYILPLYPALAILIAVYITNLREHYESRTIYRRIVTALGAVMIAVGAFYSFVSLYLNRKPEEPGAKLARLAQSKSPDDNEPLVLLSGVEPFYAQIPLFYSDRPVQQTYLSLKPESNDAERYVSYEDLASVAQASSKRIILRKEDIERLSADYDIQVVAENGSLAFATIKHR